MAERSQYSQRTFVNCKNLNIFQASEPYNAEKQQAARVNKMLSKTEKLATYEVCCNSHSQNLRAKNQIQAENALNE